MSLLDDLSFFLLDAVWRFSLPLKTFSKDNKELGLHLNKGVPEYSSPELIATLHRLFAAGDIYAEVQCGNRYRALRNPTLDQIEAGILDTIRISYGLTLQGGRRWLAITEFD